MVPGSAAPGTGTATPAPAFDSESYTYGYSFSEELLQEWDWKEHYSSQPENERYLNYVADKFDLRRDIEFNARIASAVYDEGENLWLVETEDGRRARGRFLITAVGILSAHYIPDFPGLESYQGSWCHTGRWPKEGMDLAGKRVGVIGTGATAVQLIPEIVDEVAHLTVFQRTPNYCAPLRNFPRSIRKHSAGSRRTTRIFSRGAARLPARSFTLATPGPDWRSRRKSVGSCTRNCGRSPASRSG